MFLVLPPVTTAAATEQPLPLPLPPSSLPVTYQPALP
jgi:hypothetical protein